MTRILAIDPGTHESGWCLLKEDGSLESFGIDDNAVLIARIATPFGFSDVFPDVMAVEMVASYGMAVGKETFRTVWWSGRFADRWFICTRDLPVEIYRTQVKNYLCGSSKANDSNIRQALIDRYGGEGGKATAIGTKASPGPLYGVSKHVWAALAVAVTAMAEIKAKEYSA